MKFLKLILWSILLFCAVWIGIILFGPSLVSKGVNYFSEGRINLSRVAVSPRFEVSAAVVNFSFPSKLGKNDLSGVIRALSLDWRIENGFEVFGSTGPSKISENETLQSVNFKLKPVSILDWSEVDMQLGFKKLNGINFQLDQGNFKGKLVEEFEFFKDAELVLSEAHGFFKGNVSKVESIIFEIDKYKIDQPLTQQNSKISYGLQKVSFHEGTVQGSSAEGDIKLLKGFADFRMSMKEPHLSGQSLKAKTLTLSAMNPISIETFDGSVKFSISEIESTTPVAKVENYSGQLTFNPLAISQNGRAIISKLELKNDQYYVGEINDGFFDLSFSGQVLPSGIKLKAQGGLTLKSTNDFNAKIFIEALLPEEKISDCFELDCAIENFKADYRIMASGASLAGSFECAMVGCFNRPSIHVLQTDDTNAFFESLSTVGILSPLSLPIIYMSFLSGEAVGNGHVLNY